MTWLLDTHTFLWFCQGDPSSSPNAKTLIEDPTNRKLVSVAMLGDCHQSGLEETAPRRIERDLSPCRFGSNRF